MMDILRRDDLPKNRSGGVREYRLVADSAVDDKSAETAWQRFGQLIYLADASFKPMGEQPMHDRRNIDTVSVIVEGRMEHQGSLGSGQLLAANNVLVQCAGAVGFSRNDVNPDNSANRVIELWMRPENPHGEAKCHRYTLNDSGLTRVYGGAESTGIVTGRTCVDVVMLSAGLSMDVGVPFIAYLVRGRAFANEEAVAEGDLIRAADACFDATEDTLLIVVHEMSS